METYLNLCTQYYALDKPAASAEALNFYLEYAKNAHGPIFEPMCGTGRFLIPIFEQGFDISGSDASQHMLSVCREKCNAKKLDPKLYRQFLQEMLLRDRYALIFIPSSSFGLIIDGEEAKKCLKILCDHLLPDGKLVFEIETLRGIPKDLGRSREKYVNGKNGEKMLLTTLSSYHKENQVLQTICRYDLIQNGKTAQTETEDFRVRLYQYDEINEWLEEAGFNGVSRYGDYSRRPSYAEDEMIICECVKNMEKMGE